MSEIIYVLTVIYFVYVIEEVEGDRIVAFIKDVLRVDLTQLHKAYTNLRGSVFSLIRLKTVSFV
jgi:hypothetical protein